MSKLESLKKAYTIWNSSKGQNAEEWLSLVNDEVTFYSMMEEAPGLSFAKDGSSKKEFIEYLSSFTPANGGVLLRR
jgi:hypothetical protein